MEKYLIEIAKDAIREDLSGKKIIDKEALVKAHPELAKKWATFVTLEENQSLRGCIGSLISHRPLIDDLISNAKSAAFKDSRFHPVSAEEFEKLTVEVSLLSEPQQIAYTDRKDLRRKIKVGMDGVILKKNDRLATFLPQVWEQLPDFEAFFAHLCQKAGLESGCLEQHPDILIYRVDKIKE